MSRRSLFAVVLGLVLIPSAVPASVLSDAAAALGEKEWVKLSTGFGAISTNNDFTWSDSGSWDPVNQKFTWVCSAVGTNPWEQYTYDEATNSWTQTTLGYSSSGHAYDSNTADPVGNLYFQAGGSQTNAWHRGTWNGSKYSWGNLPNPPFDPSTAASMSWVDFLDNGNGALVYVSSPSLGIIWLNGTTWTPLPMPSDQGETNWNGQHQFSQYSTKKRMLWVGGGNNNSSRSLVMNDQLQWTAMDSAPCSIEKPTNSERAYDPVSGNFLLMCPGSPPKLYELNPDTGAYTQVTGMINQPGLAVDGLAHAAIPEYGVVMFVQGWGPNRPGDNEIYLYKHTEINPTCGNGVREGAEACDGNDFGAATCLSAHGCAGTLNCTAQCTFDTSGCAPNGALDAGETCDPGPPEQLNGQTCESQFGVGWTGDLDCASTCNAFASTGCVAPPDTTPPTIVSVMATENSTTVRVTYSEPVEQSSATAPSNYAIDNGVTVSAASLASDLITVTLTPSPLSVNVDYTLTVNNVRDRATTPNTISPGTTANFEYQDIVIVEVRISDGGDDVEESQDGSVRLSSTDLELTANGTDQQTIGLRFDPLPVPQGATIVTAYVQFKVDETNIGTTSLVVEGQASDDATPFDSAVGDVTSRQRTSASTAWAPPQWTTVGEAGPDQRTPNIASSIQEIVNRPGWVAGNSLVLIINGSGTRTAEAYNGDSTGAPLLHVEYSTSTPATDPPGAPGNLKVE